MINKKKEQEDESTFDGSSVYCCLLHTFSCFHSFACDERSYTLFEWGGERVCSVRQ